MRTSIITAIAVLGVAATPALASSTPVKTVSAATHRTVAQVCQAERALAKAKKESWKLASQNCHAAKRQAKLEVSKAKLAQKQTHTAAKAPKKG